MSSIRETVLRGHVEDGGYHIPQLLPCAKPETPASKHLQEVLPLGDLVSPCVLAWRVWTDTTCVLEAQISVNHDWEAFPLILTF